MFILAAGVVFRLRHSGLELWGIPESGEGIY
jgi:hypothetical protein